MYGFDPTYIIILPAIIFAFYAQFKVQSTFNKFLNVYNSKGYTGAQTARTILDRNGLKNVNIELTGGHLSDHYDPRVRVLRLSNEVYYGTSVASVSVAAHEVGHAIQHANDYFPLTFRNKLVPVANIGSTMAWPLAILGIFMGMPAFLDIGILLFLGAVVFQIVTLPVEFNASSRAINQLVTNHLISLDEERISKKVLDAAALTYVAAAATAILNLVRLLILRNNSED